MIAYTRRELLGLLGTAALAKSGPQPNILYIMADDHAAHAISAYGSRINQTPNIDRIAQPAACASPTASAPTPSARPAAPRFSPASTATRTASTPSNDRSIPSATTSPRNCRSAGYQTAMIGKWHLASDPTGFDYWNILPGQGVYHDPDFIDSRRPQEVHRLLHRPDRRFLAGLAQAARPARSRSS